MNKIILCGLLSVVLFGCSSVQYRTSERCLTYSIDGDSVSWKPVKFYQDQDSLYIQLPESTNFVPKLSVLDQEFDQRTSIPYTYNPTTKTFRVKDNYNEYLLTRRDVEEFYEDKVAIKCNRSVPLSKVEASSSLGE